MNVLLRLIISIIFVYITDFGLKCLRNSSLSKNDKMLILTAILYLLTLILSFMLYFYFKIVKFNDFSGHCVSIIFFIMFFFLFPEIASYEK